MSPDAARALLGRCFAVAVDAADPARAVRLAVARNRQTLAGAEKVLIAAIGKAACAMADAAAAELGDRVVAGVVVTTREAARPVAGFQVIAGGHPVPDAGSLEGGEAILALARQAGKEDIVLALISGGGSALAVAPRPGITLARKQEITEALLRSGADITAVNALRRNLSRLKGGGLLAAAAPARVLSFIVSDVPGDDPAIIASGPTAPGVPKDSAGYRQALDELGRLLLASEREAMAGSADAYGSVLYQNEIIASNAASVAAVGRYLASQGITSVCLNGWLGGDVQAAAEAILAAMRLTVDQVHRTAVVFGGETTVRVTGDGLGGRNQELVLRLAESEAASPLGRPWVFLSAGTDGRDGPTNAAGGFSDNGTLSRLEHQGLNLADILARNDSYSALAATDDLFMTGPTGTNVADIQIALIG